MVTLMTQFYISANPQRNRELELCFRENLKNKRISRFVWFVEESQRNKVPKWLQGEVIVLPDRLKFRDAFAAARPNDLHILCNSDIIISARAVQQIQDYLGPNQAYCLSRWDAYARDPLNANLARHYNKATSQDTWCWRGKLNCWGDCMLGVPGCDGRIAHELKKVCQVSNPSQTIKTLHVHASRYRNYPKGLVAPLPYYRPPPTRL